MTTGKNDRIRIIIVENDEDERHFMQEGFEQSEYFEVLALLKNGDLLLDWLAKNTAKPSVILSDLNMPGKNGYDIIQQVSGKGAYGIPVIITSTSTTRSIIDKCLNMGAADYVVKPDTFVEYKEFADRLYELIKKKKIVNGQA